MVTIEETLIKRAQTLLDDGVEISDSIEKLASLPCHSLKGVTKEIGAQLKAKMDVSSIEGLAQVDLDQQEETIAQSGWDLIDFEKWVLAARILLKISSQKIENVKKILLLGLDNAGKSAIRETIIRKYESDPTILYECIKELKPTRGVERESIFIAGNELQLWDMGGQKQYRASYLKEPERFLFNIPVIIYIIDVQENKRFDETIEYLERLATTFRSLNENPTFIVCFHKLDPNIEQEEKLRDWMADLWKKSSNILEKNHFVHKKFETSIYDDFTLFHFFSEALKLVIDFDIKKLLTKMLGDSAQAVGLDNLVLLSENGLKIGEYVENEKLALDLYEQLYPISIQTIISFKRLNKSLKNKKPLKSLYYSFYTLDGLNFLMTRVLLLNQSVYIVSMHPTMKELDEKFVLTLMPWLSNIFM